MSACPIKTSPQWIQLESKFGDTDAHKIWNVNNFSYPDSVEEAENILDGINKGLSKEEIADSNVQFKINRIQNQVDALSSIESRLQRLGEPALGKYNTVKTLKSKLLEYIELLKTKGVRGTVSVSDLFSNYDLNLADEYKSYTNFGNFVHEFVEELQNELIASNGSSILSLFNRKRLKQFHKEFIERRKKSADGRMTIKNLFDVVDGKNIMNEDELFNMMNDILSTVQTYVSQGYTILPEVTIVGNDHNNRTVVGRTDMLAVDNSGQVVILDFKTKKLKANSNIGYDHLSKSYNVAVSENADREFATTGKRNTYDQWDIQLGIYQQILEQMGISVLDKYIVGLLYYGTFQGPKQIVNNKDLFEYDYYKLRLYRSSENAFDPNLNKKRLKEYQALMAKVRKVIPVQNQNQDTSSSQSSQVNDFYDNIPDSEVKRLIQQIKTRTESELVSVIKQISDLKEQERNASTQEKKDAIKSLQKYFETRRDSLNQIKDRLSKPVEENQEWKTVYRLADIVKYLEIDIKDLIKKAESVTQNTDLSLLERANYINELHRAASSYQSVVEQIKDIFTNAQVSSDERAFQTLTDLLSKIKQVESYYTQLGFSFIVDMLSNVLTDQAAEKQNKTKNSALGARLKYLQGQIQRLKDAGQTSNLWSKLSNKISNTLTGEQSEPMNDLEKLELQVLQIESELKGVNFSSPDAVKEYIWGITQPDSLTYIGKDTGFFTDIIASSSSADPVLASFTNKLKVATSNAIKGYVNFIEREGIQDELDRVRRIIPDNDALNNAISQRHTESFINSDGEIETKEVRSFTRPWTEEYLLKFYDYRNNYNLLLRQILNAENEDQRKELRSQFAKLKDDFLDWRLENTQLPFVTEVYEMEKLLPAEYREKRAEIYTKMNEIRNSHGFNNADLLSDEETFVLREYESQLSKLEKEYLDKKLDGWQRYKELKEKFYSYEPDYDHFKRLKDQKIAELTDENGNFSPESSERYKRWIQENTFTRPKQDWYDLVQDLYDEAFDILGTQDQTIQDLYTERRAILSQYRFKGSIDSNLIPDEDLAKLEEIEQLIAEIKSEREEYNLTYEQSERLNDIFRLLEVIQTKKSSEFYEKNFNNELGELETAWSRYNQETDSQLKEDALKNFLIIEQNFATWYNKNHVNRYISKLSPKNKGLNPIPKSFNLQNWPTSETDLETEIPDHKFSIRKLKPEAYNILYKEDAEGIPLPKGVYADEDIESGVAYKFFGSSQWFNPEYIKISSNPELSDFYHSFIGRFLKFQETTTGKGLGYNFPGYVIKSVDDYVEKGLKDSFQNRMKLLRDQFFQNEYYDYLNHGYIGSGQGVIFKHNTALPYDQQSPDGIGSVVKWFEEAHINKSMAEINVLSESAIKAMTILRANVNASTLPDKQQRLKGLDTVIASMQAEYDKFVKGEYKKDEGNISRYGDAVLRGLGFTRLALDIPSQIGNMFSGNVQAFLGTHKSSHYAFKNYLWAKSKVYDSKDGFMISSLRDISKIGKRSFITKMYSYFSPQQEQVSMDYDRARSGKRRFTQGAADMEFNFAIQNAGEIEIAATIWLSILDAHKVKLVKTRDVNGNIVEYQKDADGNDIVINAFEAYRENDEGEIVIRDDADWSIRQEEQLQKTVWSEVRRTQGNYGKWDQSKFEQRFLGRLVTFYRKYLEPAVRNRAGRLEYDWESGDMRMGTYWGLVRTFQYFGYKEAVKMIFGKQLSDSDVGWFYQRKSQSAAKELGTGLALSMLTSMLLAAVPDDDDLTDGERIVLYNLLAIYAKVDMETRSLIPEPFFIGRPQEYITNFTDLTNAGRDVGRMLDLVVDFGSYMAMRLAPDGSALEQVLADKALYQRNTKMFDKGDPKFLRAASQTFGIMNVRELYEPEERIQNFKSLVGR